MSKNNKKISWWKEKIIYQIYPRSFADANNDGCGDLRGIINHLDYLESLGVGAIWLCPIYASPMHDNGYDVSDYYQINPMFGTMDDFDELVSKARKHGIYILMDLVCNHTSTEHIWFKKAIEDKNSIYHDFYFFKKEADDKRSSFGGSAWKYVQELDEYYYHYFDESQADLNWSNPKVREEVAKIVNFWLAKGCKGFRLDAIELISKDLEKNIFYNGPHIHEYLHELNIKSFSLYDETMTVGEGWPTVEIALEYTKEENQELSMMFQFETPTLDWNPSELSKYSPIPVDFRHYRNSLSKWQYGFKKEGWNAIFLENHDLGRTVSRYGNDKQFLKQSAKALATSIFFLKGTIFLYQGEELGLPNPYFESLDMYNDVDSLTKYQELVIEQKKMTEKDFMYGLTQNSRDNARCPMPWDDSVNNGFNVGTKPWLSSGEMFENLNVQKQESDKDSVLNYYKKLINLRTIEYKDLMYYGKFEDLSDIFNIDELYIYTRTYLNEKILVIVNLKENKFEIDINKLGINGVSKCDVLISNYNKEMLTNEINSYEAIVIKINN